MANLEELLLKITDVKTLTESQSNETLKAVLEPEVRSFVKESLEKKEYVMKEDDNADYEEEVVDSGDGMDVSMEPEAEPEMGDDMDSEELPADLSPSTAEDEEVLDLTDASLEEVMEKLKNLPDDTVIEIVKNPPTYDVSSSSGLNEEEEICEGCDDEMYEGYGRKHMEESYGRKQDCEVEYRDGGRFVTCKDSDGSVERFMVFVVPHSFVVELYRYDRGYDSIMNKEEWEGYEKITDLVEKMCGHNEILLCHSHFRDGVETIDIGKSFTEKDWDDSATTYQPGDYFYETQGATKGHTVCAFVDHGDYDDDDLADTNKKGSTDADEIDEWIEEALQESANDRKVNEYKAIVEQYENKLRKMQERHLSEVKAMNEQLTLQRRKVKQLSEERQKYNKALTESHQLLDQLAVHNTNLLHITKLFTEQTVSRNEKVEIAKQFDNVKTVNESKILFEALSKTLPKKSPTAENAVQLKEQMTAVKATSDNRVNLKEEKTFNDPALERFNELIKYKI